jgi:membrane-bound lytic murein transglycosylase F
MIIDNTITKFMKRFVFIVTSNLIILLLGLNTVSTVCARSMQDIQTTKEIRLCLAGSAYDFYRKNGAAFAEFLGNGVKATYFQFDNWNDQFVNDSGVVIKDGEYTPAPLASGKCDLYPNDLVMEDWREKKMAFVPLFISRNTIIISKDRINEFTDVKDLAGKKAAIMEGTSYHMWLEEQNQKRFKDNPIKLVFMPQKEAIKAAEAGKVDFGIIGADGALWAAKSFAPNIHVAFPVGKTTIYGWCFRKDDRELQDAVRQFFASQKSYPESPLNKNWIEHTGLTVGEFILFVTSTPIPVDN